MTITKDTEVMLNALRKEREELHQRLLQLDRIIKRVRLGKLDNEETTESLVTTVVASEQQTVANSLTNFPKNADIKIQILRVFDIHRKAAKLKELQDIYNKLNDARYNIREPLRSLQRSRIVRMIKEKDSTRGFFWVKSEWVENDMLLDEFKPEGFDMLYKAENLEYE